MRYDFRPVAECDMCGGQSFRMLGMRLSASQGLNPRAAQGIAVPVKQCRDCSLIFADPQPVPDDLSDHYGVPPESYWTPAAFNWSPDYFSREIETAQRLMGFRPGMTALDIGAGLGKAMRSLAVAGFDTWGIEPEAAFRDRAISGMGIDPDRLRLATVESAEFAPESFDFIAFGAVLEHVYRPSQAIDRAMRWLRPGGIIQAEVPSSRWLVARLSTSTSGFAGQITSRISARCTCRSTSMSSGWSRLADTRWPTMSS